MMTVGLKVKVRANPNKISAYIKMTQNQYSEYIKTTSQ